MTCGLPLKQCALMNLSLSKVNPIQSFPIQITGPPRDHHPHYAHAQDQSTSTSKLHRRSSQTINIIIIINNNNIIIFIFAIILTISPSSPSSPIHFHLHYRQPLHHHSGRKFVQIRSFHVKTKFNLEFIVNRQPSFPTKLVRSQDQ